MKILAVDDDPVILELLTEIVRSTTAHEIVTASSAEAAIDLMTTETGLDVDCFMLDIQMPGMDGIDLCRTLRTCPDLPYKPIIMLTAMSDKSYVERAFAAGANDYITKPFEVFDVVRRIEVAEQRARKIVRETELLTKGARHGGEKVGLMQPIFIFDVDNLVDYFAFENYIPLMPRQALFGAVATAFHIRRVAEIYDALSGPDFRGLIEDVAETISDVLRDYRFLMTYAGFGTFLCVIDDRRIPNRQATVDQINLALHRLGVKVPLPGNETVRVCSGDFVRLIGGNDETLQNALFTARSSAENNGDRMERHLDDVWFMGKVTG